MRRLAPIAPFSQMRRNAAQPRPTRAVPRVVARRAAGTLGGQRLLRTRRVLLIERTTGEFPRGQRADELGR